MQLVADFWSTAWFELCRFSFAGLSACGCSTANFAQMFAFWVILTGRTIKLGPTFRLIHKIYPLIFCISNCSQPVQPSCTLDKFSPSNQSLQHTAEHNLLILKMETASSAATSEWTYFQRVVIKQKLHLIVVLLFVFLMKCCFLCVCSSGIYVVISGFYAPSKWLRHINTGITVVFTSVKCILFFCF